MYHTGPVTTPKEFPIKTADPLSAATGGHHWLLASSTGRPVIFEVYREECYCTRCGALWTQQNRYLHGSTTSTRYLWRETVLQNPPEVPPCPGDVRLTEEELARAVRDALDTPVRRPHSKRGRKGSQSAPDRETPVAPI
jgi:hypothetical protein